MNSSHSSRLLLLLFVICYILGNTAQAQNEGPATFGKVTAEDFKLPQTPIVDSSTDAVIVSRVGSVNFVGSKDQNWVSYLYKVTTRIHILHKEGFKLGTVFLPLYSRGDTKDVLKEVKAASYNLENGKVEKTELNPSDIFDVQVSPIRHDKRFTLPDIKEGSIIEYTY
ncbi:MAG: hypothetical protein KGM98_05795, partial [Bacteroidota bacterium]|nr:hypothetical protein [Bacteroidota bacterium]